MCRNSLNIYDVFKQLRSDRRRVTRRLIKIQAVRTPEWKHLQISMANYDLLAISLSLVCGSFPFDWVSNIASAHFSINSWTNFYQFSPIPQDTWASSPRNGRCGRFL